MYTIKIEPAGLTKEAEEGTLLIDLLTDAGIPLHTPCGGRGTCKKCTVTVSPLATGPETETKKKFLLACTTPLTEDLIIHTEASEESVNITLLEDIPDGIELTLAADIGTTTLQMSLVNPSTGKKWPLPYIMNPQRRYGHDVIARIAAASNGDNRRHLRDSLLRTLSLLIHDIYAAQTRLEGSITRIIISGNTAMTYFFLDIDTAPLGIFPYETAVTDFNNIDINPYQKLFPGIKRIDALPAASAFLGGDLTGGLSLLESEQIPPGTLFFDMGTNGEMFLKVNEGTIYATSCAMGPALEGMNISQGMTATPGAVNHFSIENGVLTYSVIGDLKPAGISGTALIDALSLFLDQGLVLHNGSISKTAADTKIEGLTIDNLSFHAGKFISITQKDIRGIQLARAASYAAARILLQEAGTSYDSIKRVIIAGSFGKNLYLENFKNLKFLPNFPNAEYSFAGNTSLRAAIKAACDEDFLRQTKDLRNSLNIIDLAAHKDFNDIYIESMDF